MARAVAVGLSAVVALPVGGAAAHAGAAPGASAPALSAPEFRMFSSELRIGDSGAEVERLQQRLIDLGYWLDAADGEFGGHTLHAVWALQKAAGIDRDGIVGPVTRKALDDGVRPRAQSTSGDVVEIDLERQLLLVVSDGEVEKIFTTSTGSGKTYESQGEERVAVTPKGRYTVFRDVDAWDPGPLGSLYRPKYFNRGIAIHGYTSVPPHPASHGCARVSVKAMDWLWSSGRLDIHSTVLVW
ncbi:peptidoglycan hydrolase-like protein with peptidoglycan-binding domain [Nocardiopsis mwathae]|uniref:Peptidoglycan hydrolase-like protein with peptidoglycan-binding domain n=1 Tax=Nocardiopsis mwathae TaxID=1472723 RepID=A0A7W9YF05_9ACTN|nr:peptidoglycan hydrolase-like protein with peptidoglycan-binding domain [Nocardiopsis mwathae]